MARKHGERQQDYDARRQCRTRGELVTALRTSMHIEIEIPPMCQCRGVDDPHYHARQSAEYDRNVRAAEEKAGWNEAVRKLFEEWR